MDQGAGDRHQGERAGGTGDRQEEARVKPKPLDKKVNDAAKANMTDQESRIMKNPSSQ